MFENHCSINVSSMWEWRVVVLLLRAPSGGLSLSLHHTSPPMSACVCTPYMEWLQLWGVRLAIGQIVLPAGRFSVHSWFPFQSLPLPSLPLSPQLLFSHTWTHTHTTQSKDVCSYISPPLSVWPFSGRLLCHLPLAVSTHTVHTTEEHCAQAHGPTLKH